jgi:CBS domain-containing protein
VKELLVKDVMTHLVVSFKPDDTVSDAAARLLSNRISGGPVTERGRLIGVVSETDLVAAYAPSKGPGFEPRPDKPLMFLTQGILPRDVGDVKVRDIMGTNLISISPDADLWEAASLIDRHGVRRLPVTDNENYVVGVVARADLVRALARVKDGTLSAV